MKFIASVILSTLISSTAVYFILYHQAPWNNAVHQEGLLVADSYGENRVHIGGQEVEGGERWGITFYDEAGILRQFIGSYEMNSMNVSASGIFMYDYNGEAVAKLLATDDSQFFLLGNSKNRQIEMMNSQDGVAYIVLHEPESDETVVITSSQNIPSFRKLKEGNVIWESEQD